MEFRIKELRKTLGLSQDEFGFKLGVTNTAVSGYESGRRNPTEQTILSICREFDVNEDWLRTGEGEMFEEVLQEDEFSRAAAELSKDNDELAMQAVIQYWKLDKDSRILLKNYLLSIVENVKKKE